MASRKMSLVSGPFGLTGEELFRKVEKLVPEEKRREAWTVSTSIVIPRNHQRALDDIVDLIESQDHPNKLPIYKCIWLYPKADQTAEIHHQIFVSAQNLYFKMMSLGQDVTLPVSDYHQRAKEILRIDYIQNKEQEEKFEAQRNFFIENNIPSNEIEIFHGTNENNIDSILSQNFDLLAIPDNREKRNRFGYGIYFSHYPAIANAYGKPILSRVLPGRVEEMNQHDAKMSPEIGDGFDSRRVHGLTKRGDDTMGYSVIHVIKRPSQILPYCVIHLTKLPTKVAAAPPAKTKGAKAASVPATGLPAKRKKKTIITGTQPEGVSMTFNIISTALPGFPDTDTLEFAYELPPGIQGPEHPNPGHPYIRDFFPRIAYLPRNKEGIEIYRLLREAFKRRLIFTVGKSATTGKDNSVIWAGIPHKTRKDGGGAYGYPDPDYFKTVLAKLKEKGVDAGQL